MAKGFGSTRRTANAPSVSYGTKKVQEFGDRFSLSELVGEKISTSSNVDVLKIKASTLGTKSIYDVNHDKFNRLAKEMYPQKNISLKDNDFFTAQNYLKKRDSRRIY